MRILFITFSNSIHSVRWIKQITDQGWDLHLIPSWPLTPLDPALEGEVTFYGANKSVVGAPNARKPVSPLQFLSDQGSRTVQQVKKWLHGNPQTHMLDQIIQDIKPDFIHSMEMQRAGYMILESKERMGKSFPPWMHSNWGSDIYIYHRIAAHRERVIKVIQSCDFYTADCERDVDLAKQFGLKAQILPVLSAAGGMDADQLQQFRQPGPVSQRKVILLKGYQHWVGRALVGLRAIEMCADIILERGYTVLIHLASSDVQFAAKQLEDKTGIPIEVVLLDNYLVSSYEDALRRFGSARVHLGLSISDGASQSIFESMVMGAFPIQSCTACVDEWLEDGKSGFIVPPEDPQIIAEALRRALTDDALIDEADKINDEIVRRRLNHVQLKEQVIDIYQSVYEASLAMRSA